MWGEGILIQPIRTNHYGSFFVAEAGEFLKEKKFPGLTPLRRFKKTMLQIFSAGLAPVFAI